MKKKSHQPNGLGGEICLPTEHSKYLFMATQKQTAVEQNWHVFPTFISITLPVMKM